MGNGAVIVWRDRNGDVTPDSVGVYLHYNGGRDSVRAFLAYCEICGFSNPAEDECDFARFVQVVANFLQGDGIGVACLRNLDTDGDNGVYVCDGWDIVERQNFHGPEQDKHDLREMIRAVNEAQPDAIRKSEDRLEKLLTEYMEKLFTAKSAVEKRKQPRPEGRSFIVTSNEVLHSDGLQRPQCFDLH